MARHLWLAFVVIVGLVVLGGEQRPRPLAAQPADETRLDVVRAGYDILLDFFFRPLAPDELLRGGWAALTDAARRADLPAPPPLPPLPEGREPAFAAFSEAYLEFVAVLPSEVSAETVAFTIVDGMAESTNEGHTFFLTPAQYRNQLVSAGGGELPVGLGITLTNTPPRIVTDVAPDGPADRAGMIVGDVIIAVDGRDVANATAQEFAQAVAGPAGTVRLITVDRGGQRLDLTVTRGPFYFPPLTTRLLPGGIGYVRLRQFPSSGVELANGVEFLSDLDQRLDQLDAQGVRGLILDLRNNSGGSTLTWRELLARFLPEDTLTIIRSDQRGRSSTGIVSGVMRRVQHPIVVLVNGGSASASEITAAVLREENRAVLAGQRTAGALSGALLLPLPHGAGLQVAVQEAVTARERVKIDAAGYPVDLAVPDTRAAADYLAGRDPQLEAAIAALDRAPAPPAFRSNPSGMSEARLRSLLAPYMPAPEQFPRNDRLTQVVRTETRTLVHPNQAIGESMRDPLAGLMAFRRRGWLGAHSQGYGVERGVPPGFGISIELYAGEEGATEPLATNDAPDLQEPIASPIQLGDQTVAYRGVWRNLGEISITWRRGSVVFSAGYGDLPGFERMETLVEIARLVDEAYARMPLLEAVKPTR